MEKPGTWPDWLDGVWAKSPVREGEPGESLAAHTWEVLRRLRDQAELRPWLPEWSGFPDLWRVLFWAALLHDWGKAATGFQDMLRSRGRWPHRHEVLSLAFLDWLAPSLSEEVSLAVAAVVLSHHRDEPELRTWYPPRVLPEDDPVTALLRELDESRVTGLWRWMAEVVPEWLVDLRFTELGVEAIYPPVRETAVDQVLQGGNGCIRHWLRQYYRLVRAMRDGNATFPAALAGIFLRGGLLQADHAGSAHLSGLPPLRLSREAIFAASRLPRDSLHEHQEQAANTSGSAILVAPTGSGKTEAALLWAVAQDHPERCVPRLFYTLPYQASMNAMYDRLNSHFPGQVGLIHSRSVLALYQRFMEQDYTVEEAARLARWVRDMADLHYHPIRVFSPYQMLKAAYQIKGYEATLSDFTGGAFIFDEIHAYEPERLALILETVRYLREWFYARFFVMSATLPSPVLRRLEDALGRPVSITASGDLFHAFTRHRCHLVAGDLLSEEGMTRALNAFQKGDSVLVTLNTVTRAQKFYQQVKNLIPAESLILIHGRFNGRDRLDKEHAVKKATGLLSPHRRTVMVIATQVVEVSLNIDLDVLFTDPAPLEALIQRFGRINRGRRLPLATVYVFSEPLGGDGVYLAEMVAGALRVLAIQGDGQPIHEGAVQRWLDDIYSGNLVRAWDEKYERVATEFRQVFLNNLRPFGADVGLEDAFEKLFDGTEVLPAGLADEFARMRGERPIEASQLLVPISWRRWEQLLRAGKVRSLPGQWPRVVDAPYSGEVGLVFDPIGASGIESWRR